MVLQAMVKAGLVKGQTIGVDATTLEANAAMKSIVRHDTGQSYEAYLEELAKQSGIDEPTRADLAKLDKRRKNKASNDDWHNPNDPDARITKMKDGRTHLAYKVEHAADLETGAMVSVVIHPADRGDTESGWESLAEAAENLHAVQESCPEEAAALQECVADRGYHSGQVLSDLEAVGIRTYIAEPNRGRRNWKGKAGEQKSVYANRRRMKRAKAKGLHRRRAEILERSFAHMLDTGGMRRVWLRGRENVWKRYLIHACAFNLSLVMRTLYRAGTPRGLEALVRLLLRLIHALSVPFRPFPALVPQEAP
jgi:transposase